MSPRRHHNTDGRRQIQRGRLKDDAARIARRLGIDQRPQDPLAICAADWNRLETPCLASARKDFPMSDSSDHPVPTALPRLRPHPPEVTMTEYARLHLLTRLRQALTDVCGFRTNGGAEVYAEVEDLLARLRPQEVPQPLDNWEGDLPTEHPNRCHLRDNLLYVDIFNDDGSHRAVWRCHKRAGHDGPCSSHDDCGVRAIDGVTTCGLLSGHSGPHAWATEIRVDAALIAGIHHPQPEENKDEEDLARMDKRDSSVSSSPPQPPNGDK